MATIAALQTELKHAQQALGLALERAEKAEEKIAALEQEIEQLQSSQRAATDDLKDQLSAARLEREQAHGEAKTLRAQLDAYSLAYGMGRDHPLPLAAIIALTAVSVAALVIILLIVVRLVL
jgi:septal ring factor EnvC (AmiA/AmiB activator)